MARRCKSAPSAAMNANKKLLGDVAGRAPFPVPPGYRKHSCGDYYLANGPVKAFMRAFGGLFPARNRTPDRAAGVFLRCKDRPGRNV